jgi:tRNA wybutosine-synthesizing protein 3
LIWEKYKQQKINSLNSAIEKKLVDQQILKLLKKINKNPSLVSSSSCSGRIVLLQLGEEGKKSASFYAKWHTPADVGDVEMKLSEYTGRMPLWFRVEPFILHVAAKDIDSAKTFLEKIRSAGIKRGGIQTIKKEKVTIEIQGSGYLSVPAEPINQWTLLIKIANEMMKKNLNLLRKLEKLDW